MTKNEDIYAESIIFFYSSILLFISAKMAASCFGRESHHNTLHLPEFAHNQGRTMCPGWKGHPRWDLALHL
ncbi:hypothetical protein BCR37DRAFT_377949 [Protomyces lactucae-debilis]|uniref:Uncharacterized protein n=1 Tax=Protomyces lactucae-debilis TaxID=2754530 RepID=A0A1Y2FLY5_PROLT|nr:uncharacterized protein BCR37DRAFT_377949 [Protomyces lactucae-debilis]ORY84980.1 hypothetical protein BCR37DRAFT_377949 [Protomyces lactucae-debilis]